MQEWYLLIDMLGYKLSKGGVGKIAEKLVSGIERLEARFVIS